MWWCIQLSCMNVRGGGGGAKSPTDHFSWHKSSIPINLNQIAPMVPIILSGMVNLQM